MNIDSVVEITMTYGPSVLRVGLLAMTIYHAWQRNILKAAVSAVACLCTFVLGW